MKLLRSARFPAILLLVAAAIGLILANSPVGEAAIELKHTYVGIPGFLEMSVGHWIADGLLAIFFFSVAVELQYELTNGELNSARRALQPAIAAAGGVLVPIAIYLAFAWDPSIRDGWPIPTATDIAFALGVLAVFGKGLPSAVRVFLLALAIIDDIVGIVFIAVLFAKDVNLGTFAIGLVLIAVFAVLSRVLGQRGRWFVIAAMIVVAVAAWVFVYESGVHATIAGVLLGLSMRQSVGMHARHTLEPWINGFVLPVFAISAALVVIPAVSLNELSPALWGILVALPVGKIIGIAGFGWIGMQFRPRGTPPAVRFPDMIAAGALGGIGFTVSLLLSELAFADNDLVADEAILGVLGGSVISLIVSGVLVSMRARHYRRIGAAEKEPAE